MNDHDHENAKEIRAQVAVQSPDLLFSLMEHTSDHIYFKDRDSRFLLISRALSRRFGLAHPHDACGKTDADYFNPVHAEEALADELYIMRTGIPIVNKEEKEVWPNGSETWVSTSKLPLRDPRGHIIGTFGISRDITTQKMAAQRQHEMEMKERAVLERTDRLNTMGILAAGMAHEINNPLQGMLSHLRNAKTQIANNKVALNNLKMVERGIHSISGLVHKLLTLGSPEVHLHEEGTDVQVCLDFVIQLVGSQLQRTKVALCRKGEAMRDAVAIPEAALIQILLNLIINARDAMPDGGTVSVDVKREDNHAVITVEDSGTGVSPAIRPHLFTPFYTTKGTHGTGLGLVVAASLAQASGGHLSLDENKESGARFILHVPLLFPSPTSD